MNFRDVAAFYVSIGWKVFPLQPGSKRPFDGSRGVIDATDDALAIDVWHARAPDSNIAVACGASGLMVVDLDPRNHCWQTLARWEADRKVLPMTVHARTRSGGLHLYFSLAAPLPEGWRRKLPGGVDIQVGNKYVVAPPSIIAADKVDDGLAGAYTWLRNPIGASLPYPPKWLMEMLKPPAAPKYTGKRAEGSVERRVEGALTKVRNAGKGDRNNELNKQAHLLGRMIVEDGLDADMVEQRLLEAGLGANPEYGQKATLATIRSGVRKGMLHAGGGKR
jgi:hypothetical protein